MKKKGLLIALLLMAVGFAAVSTTLVINGTSTIKKNTDDFKVYYSDALVNGKQDLSVVVDDTHLSFKTTLDTLGQTYVLDYDVTNSSKNYDAKLKMNCTGGNEYLTVVNSFNTTDNLLATETRRGKLTLTLAKSYTGNDLDVEIECTIDADAVERNSIATGTPASPAKPSDLVFDAFSPTYFAYGKPTTSSTTDYNTLGRNVFVGLNDENSLGVCVNKNGLFCIKNNDFDNSKKALVQHFREDNCSVDESLANCYSGSVCCYATSDGLVHCYDYDEDDCKVDSSGKVTCG